MKRRDLLKAALGLGGLGLVGLAWQGGLCSVLDLQHTLWAAQRAGKPLLLLLFPDDRRVAMHRGGLFGSLLTHGTDAHRLVLGLAHIACACESVVRQRFPELAEGSALALVETDEPDPSLEGFELPLLREPELCRANEYEANQALQTWQGKRFIEDLAACLTERLWEEQVQSRRVAQLEATLGERREAVRERLDGPLTPDEAFELAALVLEQGSEANITALSQAIAERYCKAAPPGAVWATYACGIREEGRIQFSLGSLFRSCGIGHLPPLSRRFLHVYTAS